MKHNQWQFGILAVALAGPACREKKSDSTAASGASAAAPSATAAASSTGVVPHIIPLPGGTVGILAGVKPKLFRIPLEPRLAILPGQGLGPIRFGATVETVERLLGAKCAEKTETLCRMWGHALDFVFADGAVVEMRAHGEERPFSDKPDDTYGIFNGAFQRDAALGMYAPFVIQAVGEPQRVDKLEPKGKFPTVERHHYPDMVLEYDRLKNGNVVLAGIILTKPTSQPGPGKSGAAGANAGSGSTASSGTGTSGPGTNKPAPKKAP